jgi:hypothetical protein
MYMKTAPKSPFWGKLGAAMLPQPVYFGCLVELLFFG